MLRARRAAGFTLLELVVAITLMGLLLVVLYGGLRTGLNSWEGGEAHIAATERMQLVEAFLRRQLAESLAIPPTGSEKSTEPSEKSPQFVGSPQQIQFVAPLLTQLGQGGLYQIQVAYADARLIVRFEPARSYTSTEIITEATAAPQWESVLLEEVSALEWSYFGTTQRPIVDGAAHPPQWSNTWERTDERPVLVRLNITVRGVPWPDLVVALTEGPQSP